MKRVTFLSDQLAFMRYFGNDRTNDVPEWMDDEKEDREFEGMVSTKELVTISIGGRLREVQRISENGGEAVLSEFAEVTDLVWKGVETERKNSKLSERNTELKANFAETSHAAITITGWFQSVFRKVTALKQLVANVAALLEKLTSSAFQTVVDLQARVASCLKDASQAS